MTDELKLPHYDVAMKLFKKTRDYVEADFATRRMLRDGFGKGWDAAKGWCPSCKSYFSDCRCERT